MSVIGIAICLNPDLEAEIIREISAQDLPLTVIRRCRDAAEILATAKAHLVEFIIVDTEIIELDTHTRAELRESGATVMAFTPLDDVESLKSSGVAVLAKSDPRVPENGENDVERILALVTQLVMPPPPPDPRENLTDLPRTSGSVSESGKAIAFWGAPGAPGKSTVMINLASFLHSYGKVLLIDADTVEPSLAQMLGVSLETSGVIVGCRLAEQGNLSHQNFAEIITKVGSGVDLLSGMNKGDRWREVGEKPLAALIEWAKEKYQWILIDLAPGFDDSETPFLDIGPSRNGAQLGALSVADLVVEVGLADPVGLRRLIVNHEQAMERGLWQCPTIVTVNRGRPSVGGAQWQKSIHQILDQFVSGVSAVTIREAGEEIDRALVAACDVATVNPEAEILEDFMMLQNRILNVFGIIPRRAASKKQRRK